MVVTIGATVHGTAILRTGEFRSVDSDNTKSAKNPIVQVVLLLLLRSADETKQHTTANTPTPPHKWETYLDRPWHGQQAARHEPDQVRSSFAMFRNPWVIHDLDGRDALVGVVS